MTNGFMNDEFVLPELLIEGITEEVKPVDRKNKAQVDSFLLRLSAVSQSADKEAVVKQALVTSYNLVGFGPMVAALESLAS